MTILIVSGLKMLLQIHLSTSLVSHFSHHLSQSMALVFSCLQFSLVLGKYSVNSYNRLLMASRYASLDVNYMTIPVYVVGAFSLVTLVYLSDRLKRRGVFIMGCFIPVAIGYLICVATPNPHAGYAGMFILVLGKFYSTHGYS